MLNSIFSLFKNNDDEKNQDNSNKEIHINVRRCPQNHRCPSIRVCPVGAITQKGYKLPKVDMEKCIKCGKCIKYCPMRAITLS